MVLVQYLTVSTVVLLATSVLGLATITTPYATGAAALQASSSGVLFAGQTLPQVCMHIHILRRYRVYMRIVSHQPHQLACSECGGFADHHLNDKGV